MNKNSFVLSIKLQTLMRTPGSCYFVSQFRPQIRLESGQMTKIKGLRYPETGYQGGWERVQIEAC